MMLRPPLRRRRLDWVGRRRTAREILKRTAGRPSLRDFLLRKLRELDPRRVGSILEMFPAESADGARRSAAALLRHVVHRPEPERRLWRTEERQLRRHVQILRSHHVHVQRLEKVRLRIETRRRRSTSRTSRSTGARSRSRRRSRRSASDDGLGQEVRDVGRAHRDGPLPHGEPS